ncbi:hypothetical protein IFR04_004057 [Cadophora malorum]|uniref:2EXR domain-containing protein n=1 Tax=Cadophora malorum TaxID=108018 RepID=A0A8H7WDI8_9HELO|nr:hypothetical protein IFR04_004057 [Cadophora malorum]
MDYTFEFLTLLDRFTLFRKLPLEIRRKIWRNSTEGRIVTIKDASTWATVNGAQEWVYRVRAVYTLPAILSVCRESRNEAKKMYHWTFGHRLPHPIPFSFCIDTLLIDGPDGACTFNTFVDPPDVKDQFLAHQELILMHANLQTLIVAGNDMYLYTSEDVAGFYNLRLLVLPWKTAGNDNQLRAWMQGVWQRKLVEAKVELTAKLQLKQAAILAAAEEARARLAAELEDMSENEREETFRKADTDNHIMAIEEGKELQRLRKTKTEVMFTNGLGVEAWLGECVEVDHKASGQDSRKLTGIEALITFPCAERQQIATISKTKLLCCIQE